MDIDYTDEGCFKERQMTDNQSGTDTSQNVYINLFFVPSINMNIYPSVVRNIDILHKPLFFFNQKHAVQSRIIDILLMEILKIQF